MNPAPTTMAIEGSDIVVGTIRSRREIRLVDPAPTGLGHGGNAVTMEVLPMSDSIAGSQCSVCGSNWVVPIVYGIANACDARLETHAAIHGGCRTASARCPDSYCRTCHARWGGDAPLASDAWAHGPHRHRLDLVSEACDTRDYLVEVERVRIVEGADLDPTPALRDPLRGAPMLAELLRRNPS
jgi:hypothetical protein